MLLSSGDNFPHLIQKHRSQLGFVTYLLNYPRMYKPSFAQTYVRMVHPGQHLLRPTVCHSWHMSRASVGLSRFSGQGRCGGVKFGDILKPQHYLVTNFIVCVLSRYYGILLKRPFLSHALKSNTILQ